jgi:DEAD/DEAH box helicase domain-containing protein
VDKTIKWLRTQDRYHGRIQRHEQVPSRDAEYGSIDIIPRLDRVLTHRGIDQVYQHQADAIHAVRDDQNVVIATPTASGKSLTYTIPALERALEHGGCTLYIAPQRALINDQEETLSQFVTDLGSPTQLGVEQYTGRLSRTEKRAVRDSQPPIVLTTPDMLHYALLPWGYRQWEWFFRQLETVVLDEIHAYRGIFGSHVSLVCRRLARVCERHDSAPQFICCSATIGNPVEHASAVTGQAESTFSLVDDDMSATGPTHWLFWNPPLKEEAATEATASSREVADIPNDSDNTSDEPTPANETGETASDGGMAVPPTDAGSSTTGGNRRSNHPETVNLFCDLVTEGFQTLVFTRARQGAERYAEWCDNQLRNRGNADLAETITAYQAALTHERRTTIETGLQNGTIRGVWSTTALELGIDIGSLDVVLLDGYPGTRMQTTQRAGRAGRGTAPSLVALIASPDQLDQYLMRHPDTFFEKPPEQAVINPLNDALLPAHVLSAAQETWLAPADKEHFGSSFPDLVTKFDQMEELERRQTHNGIRWTYDGEDSPQHEMSLRSIEDRDITLIDHGRDRQLGTLSFSDALRDVHPDAIYYHQGRTYQVAELDLDADRALLESIPAQGYTDPLREKRITVEETHQTKPLAIADDVTVTFADITVREQIDRYLRYDSPNDDAPTEQILNEPLPETTLPTNALILTFPERLRHAVVPLSPDEQRIDSGLHALEHALISLFPLELLCDRGDLGGLSISRHPDTGQATIFIHDAYPGGVGLARGGYDRIDELLEQTHSLLDSCPCTDGCPSCVQSPQCGNANQHLDKQLALAILTRL